MYNNCLFVFLSEKDTLDVWVNGKRVETTVYFEFFSLIIQ